MVGKKRKEAGAVEGFGQAMSERREHVVVGAVSEFPEGSHRVVRVGRRQIGVFNIGGKFYGLPNVCPHQTGPLCEGKPPLGTLVSRL